MDHGGGDGGNGGFGKVFIVLDKVPVALDPCERALVVLPRISKPWMRPPRSSPNIARRGRERRSRGVSRGDIGARLRYVVV